MGWEKRGRGQVVKTQAACRTEPVEVLLIMKQMFAYILECSDKSYYTGVTNDVERRVAEHNEGTDKESYTFKRRPVKLLFHTVFNDPLQAIQFEKQLKGWSRKKKEAIINGNWDLLPDLSKSKTPINKDPSTSSG